ncbi:acyl-CoA dehydrogenase family protein [Brevibacterium album]|uniref:acyl-CoA dehydrogenase family protein n=1 Tax=Brevibacterium album TaxID=417948 RepID=UPI00041A3C4A|nr:acyl-CoA dehydrogenase family protein [Brevibacterium album]
MAAEDEFERIAGDFRAIFEAAAPEAAARDREHTLPADAVRALATRGFGALRIPQADGGPGLSLPQTARLWIEAAAADANLPQIFRGQFAFAEDRIHARDASRQAWLDRFLAGEFVGNAWSETGASTTSGAATRLRSTPHGLRLEGRKHYTTGTLYADWADVTATDDSGRTVAVIVPTADPGVSVSDDWDGFGQRLTGTGTAVFSDVPVDPAHVTELTGRFSYQTAHYQLVLLSVLAGIAARAASDVALAVRERTRVYTHGLAPLARHDGQILAVVGQVRSTAFAAEAVVAHAAAALQRVSDLEHERGSAAHLAASAEAELATAQGQVVLSEQVPQALGRLFDALGASGTSRELGLDRHWRNARTVASHNPVVYKQRIIGDWAVNGTDPVRLWDVGITDRPAEQPDHTHEEVPA